MKLTTSNTLQILGSLIQLLNLALMVFKPIMPNNVSIVVSFVVGALQIVVNTIAHNSNPDGTPASVAYVKPTEVMG